MISILFNALIFLIIVILGNVVFLYVARTKEISIISPNIPSTSVVH